MRQDTANNGYAIFFQKRALPELRNVVAECAILNNDPTLFDEQLARFLEAVFMAIILPNFFEEFGPSLKTNYPDKINLKIMTYIASLMVAEIIHNRLQRHLSHLPLEIFKKELHVSSALYYMGHPTRSSVSADPRLPRAVTELKILNGFRRHLSTDEASHQLDFIAWKQRVLTDIDSEMSDSIRINQLSFPLFSEKNIPDEAELKANILKSHSQVRAEAHIEQYCKNKPDSALAARLLEAINYRTTSQIHIVRII